MLDKKVTRKEFLLGALSFGGLIVASKMHPLIKKAVAAKSAEKKDNSYGNFAYGGPKKNA